MKIMAAEAQANLFQLIKRVNQDKKAVLITSEKGNAFLISESEYKSILETEYLFSSPANREHLLESMAQADRGETFEIEFPTDAETLVKSLKDAIEK
jgi:antitoxin YefM